MVFLCWAKPSLQEQKDCLNKSSGFNYDSKYRGATAKPASSLKEDNELSKDGFLINHARVLVGSGVETYEKGKLALENWRHFGFDWGFVDSKTPIQSGVKFCVCVKEFLPWVMMPLQTVYVNEIRSSKKDMASFCFGGGTLQGHLLAGEERFSIEMDEKNQVCVVRCHGRSATPNPLAAASLDGALSVHCKTSLRLLPRAGSSNSNTELLLLGGTTTLLLPKKKRKKMILGFGSK